MSDGLVILAGLVAMVGYGALLWFNLPVGRYRGRSTSLCGRCGHTVRAGQAGRCPECGHVVASFNDLGVYEGVDRLPSFGALLGGLVLASLPAVIADGLYRPRGAPGYGGWCALALIVALTLHIFGVAAGSTYRDPRATRRLLWRPMLLQAIAVAGLLLGAWIIGRQREAGLFVVLVGSAVTFWTHVLMLRRYQHVVTQSRWRSPDG